LIVRIAGGALALVLALGACQLSPRDELGRQMENFYRNVAWEENATCLSVEMGITRMEILEETPERMMVRARYWYEDRTIDRGGDGSGVSMIDAFTCRGVGERVFEVARRADGSFQVVSMTGPQRG
jgi:hypothetical protein